MDPNARLPDEVFIKATPSVAIELLEAGSPGKLFTKEELSIAAHGEEPVVPLAEEPTQETTEPVEPVEKQEEKDEAEPAETEPAMPEEKPSDEEKKED
jgi:hypothetical protein